MLSPNKALPSFQYHMRTSSKWLPDLRAILRHFKHSSGLAALLEMHFTIKVFLEIFLNAPKFYVMDYVCSTSTEWSLTFPIIKVVYIFQISYGSVL